MNIAKKGKVDEKNSINQLLDTISSLKISVRHADKSVGDVIKRSS
jgi:hypothetical protein